VIGMVFKIVDFPNVFNSFADVGDMSGGNFAIISPIDILVSHKLFLSVANQY
jgi:hypothetical protein